ncbi:hypothetical protein CH063_05948 [Colletotrichum higginsianum]|uniref:Uncharacterized protein n=1 Tax=Colletotrichum higginsianum (strain IMI 349063) TaxID=759273 RepID=H1V0U3_COLHI|nr:hypothetical protein CH063_05948 [Colletotrichum higginsianum]
MKSYMRTVSLVFLGSPTTQLVRGSSRKRKCISEDHHAVTRCGPRKRTSPTSEWRPRSQSCAS